MNLQKCRGRLRGAGEAARQAISTGNALVRQIYSGAARPRVDSAAALILNQSFIRVPDEPGAAIALNAEAMKHYSQRDQENQRIDNRQFS
jgi:hypothetical protein